MTSPAENRVQIICPCGRRLHVKAGRTRPFKCKYCGKMLKLTADAAAIPPVNPLLDEIEPALAPTPQLPDSLPLPPAQVAGHWTGNQPRAGSSLPRRKTRTRNNRLSAKDIVTGIFGAILLIGVIVLIILAGIANFAGDHSPPGEVNVASVTGPPRMSSDNSNRLRRKSFSFTVGGESFYLDKEHWDDAVYERIRNAVYESDELVVGVPPEERETHVPFWYLRADGNTICSYQDMVELHNYHRRMATIAVSAYGAVFLFSAIGGLVVLIRRFTGK